MAFMRDKGYTTEVEDTMRFITSSIENGGSFGGSTQATILCLKALIMYYDTHAELRSPAIFLLKVNGNVVDSIKYTNTTSKVQFNETDIEPEKIDENKIELSMKI
jgi:hypothetical protein